MIGEDHDLTNEIITNKLEILFKIEERMNSLLISNFTSFRPFVECVKIYFEITAKIEKFIESIEFIYYKIYQKNILEKFEISYKSISFKLNYISLKFDDKKEEFNKTKITIEKLKELIKPNKKLLTGANVGIAMFEEYIATLLCKNEHQSLVTKATCHTKLALDEQICKYYK